MKRDIAKALEVLQKNRSQIKTVDMWADFMGYQTQKEFSRCFLWHFGTRPKKEFDRIWAEDSIKALKQSDKQATLYAIARDLGYENEGCMYNLVKRITKKPPSYYRDNFDD